MKEELNVCWLRRDLRLEDNHAMFKSLFSGRKTLILFIFDKNILDKLTSKYDRRVEFIHRQLEQINTKIKDFNSALEVRYGYPDRIWKELLNEYNVKEVFANKDYESYGMNRDLAIRTILNEWGIPLHLHKDQVIYEEKEILSGSGTPYTVFTPYSRKWKEVLGKTDIPYYASESLLNNLVTIPFRPIITIEEIGFKATEVSFFDKKIPLDIIETYHQNRDIPAMRGTTRLSVHLRFGTVSIRQMVKIARQKNEIWLNELIWRDFYMSILANFPHINHGKSFKIEYDKIQWLNNENDFQKWKEGKTGFPIVDAGMRELNTTGFMHNRVRMITASFLIKDLLVDWRWGEAYFAEKLLDFDFAANNGGWQWAAGSGCDAAPYFRIFNPDSQTKKFDAQLNYIKKWIPEFGTSNYPKPMVDHKYARERALYTYKKALSTS